MKFLRGYKEFWCALAVVLVMTTLPVVHEKFLIGDAWRGVPQSYGDEILYHSQVHEVADGYFGYGNPYLYEHRNDPPLVIFAGNWISAVPLFFHIPLFDSLMIDFVLWSIVLALLVFCFFRECGLPKWLSAAGVVLVYGLSFDLMFRPTSRQEVYPVFILFYIAIARILYAPTRLNIFLLALSTGLSFYVFGYLWQTAIITLGFLFLYAWYEKQWPLMRATFISSVLGVVLGSPILLYTYWMSHKPFFWESMGRLGLVETHLPMAEVLYSGGWIGVVALFAAVFYWRSTRARGYTAPMLVIGFLVISGFGLWVMEGSNLITGKLLETGEHMRRFIVPWLGLALPLCGYLWWQCRATLAARWRPVAVALLILLTLGTGYFFYTYVRGFAVHGEADVAAWKEQQTYAAPLQWLDAREPEPVVIWSNPHSYITAHIASLTKHYPLYIEAAIFTLTPDAELRERYLVSSYFDPVSKEYLKADMFNFSGRQVMFHVPKTIERGIKVCRIVHFYQQHPDCGVAPTPAEVLGESVFASMEQSFLSDIRPHIAHYLQKYHVAYALKDITVDAQFHPERLGAVLVYDDGRYQIYEFDKVR